MEPSLRHEAVELVTRCKAEVKDLARRSLDREDFELAKLLSDLGASLNKFSVKSEPDKSNQSSDINGIRSRSVREASEGDRFEIDGKWLALIRADKDGRSYTQRMRLSEVTDIFGLLRDKINRFSAIDLISFYNKNYESNDLKSYKAYLFIKWALEQSIIKKTSSGIYVRTPVFESKYKEWCRNNEVGHVMQETNE